MASGSLSKSKGVNNIKVPSQHHHPVAPMMQNIEVVEVSAATLLDAYRFVCELCHKGFQREQNLTLHKRVHNLPFHLKTKAAKDAMPRKVYICPEVTCINHNPSHALGDFGGLKKHYLRKHYNDKKHKCDKCDKTYAVASDLRAHSKNCSIKRYICQCGSRFSSPFRFNHHRDYCDAAIPLNSGMSNNLLSGGNNNNSISSTTYLPSSYMGDNSIINDINSLIGSTTSYIPVSGMGSNNNINNPIDPTMSHLPTFNMGHRSLQSIGDNNSHIGFTPPNLGFNLMNDPSWGLNLESIPYNISSLSSTQQNQHEFQENTGMGYYTNLMMNMDYNSVNPENTSFMGDVGYYGSLEGTNLYSGPGSSSNEFKGFSMQEEHYIPSGTPNLVANMDLYGSTSRNSNASNMVQPYEMSSSSYGGFIIPQEHNNSLFESDHFGILENSGLIMNSLHNNLVTGRSVESFTINEDVGSSYHHGNYSGYGDGSGHINYRGEGEVLNSGTLGAITGAIAPNQEQYWNQYGFRF